LALDREHATIRAPSSYIAEQLTTHYSDRIAEALRRVTGARPDVSIITRAREEVTA
jgi:chromosomal replication initiation ATPase DnaA